MPSRDRRQADNPSVGDARYDIQPPRSYFVPGGPTVRDLGKVQVKRLADIRRGGPYDKGFDDRR